MSPILVSIVTMVADAVKPKKAVEMSVDVTKAGRILIRIANLSFLL